MTIIHYTDHKGFLCGEFMDDRNCDDWTHTPSHVTCEECRQKMELMGMLPELFPGERIDFKSAKARKAGRRK